MMVMLHTDNPSAIPELDPFGPDELEFNEVLNVVPAPPLIGALLVDLGLLTQEQLHAALVMQAHEQPHTPIGEILVRCGYVAQPALDAALELQGELKARLIDAIERHTGPTADLRALVLHTHAGALAATVLTPIGVAATPAYHWPEFYSMLGATSFDLIVIGSDMFDQLSDLPEAQGIPLLVLPPCEQNRGTSSRLPLWAGALLVRFVQQVREHRRQHRLLERLYHCDDAATSEVYGARAYAAGPVPRFIA